MFKIVLLRHSSVCFSNVNKRTYLSFSVGLHLIVDGMIIFNSFTWNENFSSAFLKHGEILARFTLMKFLYIIVILFLYCYRLTCDLKCHHGLKSWNFSFGLKISIYSVPKKELFVKIVNRFCSRLHLTCFNGFSIHLCCVRDDYLSKFSCLTLFVTFSCF